jgi:hypothetical protein
MSKIRRRRPELPQDLARRAVEPAFARCSGPSGFDRSLNRRPKFRAASAVYGRG